MKKQILLKVSKNTVSGKLASAIARNVQNHEQVVVRAIGVGAVNQAVKGLAIAKKFANENGNNIAFLVNRVEVNLDVEKEEVTKKQAIEFEVFEIEEA